MDSVKEQVEFLRRHDQQSERLHFIWNRNQTTSTGRRSNNNLSIFGCACLGGSTNYFTLVNGEQFFRSSFKLSEQSSFGCSLFFPDRHVSKSHRIFSDRFSWPDFSSVDRKKRFDDAEQEISYPLDFCDESKITEDFSFVEQPRVSIGQSASTRNPKRSSLLSQKTHHRSASSVPLTNVTIDEKNSVGSDSTSTSTAFLTPKRLSFDSLNVETKSNSSSHFPNELNRTERLSTNSSSSDSLQRIEEILLSQEAKNPLLSTSNQVKSFSFESGFERTSTKLNR